MTQIFESIFDKTLAGKTVRCFEFRNRNATSIQILDYGGIIHSIKIPDKNGMVEEITIGYDSLKQYQSYNQYFGAFIGRYANRIKNAAFTLDGHPYTVTQNHGHHHLHGGTNGFDRKIWDAQILYKKDHPWLKLSCQSPHNEEGFPGNLEVEIEYTLTEADELILNYQAVTDRKTPVNLTSHTYFNLTGNSQKSILDHELEIKADHFTQIDPECIPTGELIPVQGTPLDFRKPCAIGKRIENPHPQLLSGGGYDHNYVLNQESENPESGIETPAAIVTDPDSGRKIALYCTQPGLQFYSGNNLDETQAGKNNDPIRKRHGFCLEPQHFPNSPNNPGFPSTILEPGKRYAHQLRIEFSVY